MGTYLVTANVNVTTDGFGRQVGWIDGYRDGHQVATVGYFAIAADTAELASERMFDIGNGHGHDDNGQIWPADVRSLCLGDVLYLAEGDEHETRSVHILAVDRAGFLTVAQPSNRCQVPLGGTVATSRPVETPSP